MAAPSYTSDLLTFNSASSLLGWGEFTGMTATDGDGVLDSDLAIYGTTCISESQRKSGLGSIGYYEIVSPPTWTTGYAFFIWNKFFAPNTLGTKAQGGIRVLIGNTTANYRGWYVDGSGTYAYGGWKNYAVDPKQTTLASQTQGTPSATVYAAVAMGYNLPVNGISKGNASTVDIIRYGRGLIRISGGDLTNGYGTFLGMSIVNDNATTGRWGLMQAIKGGYLWKGLMSLGLVGTLVDFRDSNVVISIDDTEFVATNFNRIEVNNASSNVQWTNVLITALGTRSKGEFQMVANATVTFIGCVFTDMNTFIFQSNAVITGSTFRRCALLTVGGASFDGCLITNSTASASVITASLDTITDTEFISDGSNHAVELTSLGSGSMNWSNKLSGYVAGSVGVPVTPTSTGNEAIYVNVASGTLTINILDGGDLPSIRSAGAAVNISISNVLEVTVIDENTKALLSTARVHIVADAGGTMTEGDVIIDKEITGADGKVVGAISAVNQPYKGLITEAGTPDLYVPKPISGVIPSGTTQITIGLVLDE